MHVRLVSVSSVSHGPNTDSVAGPTLVSPALIPNPGALRLRGLRNGEVLQDCGTE